MKSNVPQKKPPKFLLMVHQSLTTHNNCSINVHLEFSEFIDRFKVVLYNIDVTALCSVPKCKQSIFITHYTLTVVNGRWQDRLSVIITVMDLLTATLRGNITLVMGAETA